MADAAGAVAVPSFDDGLARQAGRREVRFAGAFFSLSVCGAWGRRDQEIGLLYLPLPNGDGNDIRTYTQAEFRTIHPTRWHGTAAAQAMLENFMS